MPVTTYLFIITGNTTIGDGPSGADQHPLTNGITLRPGTIKAKNVRTDQNFPVSAAIISEDETSSIAGAQDGAVREIHEDPLDPTTDVIAWEFDFVWNDVPEMGIRATLRFEELIPNMQGGVANFTVHILDEPDNEPLLDPIAIGNGPPISIGPL